MNNMTATFLAYHAQYWFVSHDVIVTFPRHDFMDDGDFLVTREKTALSLRRGWNTVTVRLAGSFNFNNFTGEITSSMHTGDLAQSRWFTWEMLPAPTGLAINNNVLTWNPVPGAVDYGVFANGNLIGYTEHTSFYLGDANLTPPVPPTIYRCGLWLEGRDI